MCHAAFCPKFTSDNESQKKLSESVKRVIIIKILNNENKFNFRDNHAGSSFRIRTKTEN